MVKYILRSQFKRNTDLLFLGHTACIVDHNMYIFGGFEEQANRFSCDVHCLNLETMTWSYVSFSNRFALRGIFAINH